MARLDRNAINVRSEEWPGRPFLLASVVQKLPAVLFALASAFAHAATDPASQPANAPGVVRDADYPITNLPTAHIFIPQVVSGSQEKQGLVWLDNRRVMFLGSVPGNPSSRGIHIWDIVANSVSQYSNHDRFCYAEGYIDALGPSKRHEGDRDRDRNFISPVRRGPLGQEKDDICDTRAKRGCPGRLNMSCKPLEYSPDSRPLGEESRIAFQLRSGDGMLLMMTIGQPNTLEERKKRLSRPLLLFSRRDPKGKALPIAGIEGTGAYGAAYSSFARRYVLVPSDPVEGRNDHSTNWPKGRPQPVYLMTAEGEVESIQVPSRPDWTTIHLAMPAMPGLVFMGSGGHANEWGGIFLYDNKREVLTLDRGYAGPLAVSPDGCKVAYAIANDYGKKRGPNYQYVKLIRFCKGEE